MTENDFTLCDRIAKIKAINGEYNLLQNAYISFSGGKDSVACSKLIDIALPGNKIPRVFINTGIEYSAIVKFVQKKASQDERIVIIPPTLNIRATLEEFGYPFKSKEHAQKMAVFQRSGFTKTVSDYLGNGDKTHFLCPKALVGTFTADFPFKVSDKCCKKMKKEPAKKWSVANNRPIIITGVRQAEGGLRQSMSGCTTFSSKNKSVLEKFHPLFPCSSEFVEWFIKEQSLELCELYAPPYNFKRTGCKGCPFSLDLQEQLDKMEKLLPAEKKQCEIIWRKVYEEYRKLQYRLTH